MNSGPLTRFSTAAQRLVRPGALGVVLQPREHQPLFGAAPEKLKPITENAAAMSGSP